MSFYTDQNPIKSHINPERMARQTLEHGVPKWLSHPQDFKQWARECYIEDKEESDNQAAIYRVEEQDTLSDEKARMIHPMDSRQFIEKLRKNGVHCFTYQVPPSAGTPEAMHNTVGLWAEVPNERGIGHLYQGINHQYMTWMDIPFMYEWSVLRVDEHKIPIGEKYRGWRTVLTRLIARKVLTEIKAHQIFGEPLGTTSKIYKRTLFNLRNGRINLNERTNEANA